MSFDIRLPPSLLQGNITGLTGTMDFKDSGSNSHVQFEILGSSFSETFGKDIKRVSSLSEQEVTEGQNQKKLQRFVTASLFSLDPSHLHFLSFLFSSKHMKLN